MNDHIEITELLPLYVSGALDASQAKAVEEHLAACAECRSDLELWKSVSIAIQTGNRSVRAPEGLADRALAGIRLQNQEKTSFLQKPSHAWQLLKSQVPLVNREIWPASALVIALGYVTALVSEKSGFLYALAPLIAAACVSLIYGPENDPSYELALSTPTSPRQVLLARLVLVFGYNLGLVLVAALGLIPLLSQQPAGLLLGPLLLAWLAPMTLLSAAALLLSLWTGAPNAISITYAAWLIQLVAGPLRSPQSPVYQSPAMMKFLAAYQTFWQSPWLLLSLAALLLVTAIWQAGRIKSINLRIA